jgi:hypothetical protein
MVKDTYSSGRQMAGEGGWASNAPQDTALLGEDVEDRTPLKVCLQHTTSLLPLAVTFTHGVLVFNRFGKFRPHASASSSGEHRQPI